MATRPQFEIELFGLRIRYWGRPAVKLAVDMPHEKSLQRLVKWVLIIYLAWRIHALQEHMLTAASLTMQQPLVRAAFGLPVAVTALFLLCAAFRRIHRRLEG
jgi:hypothetical protein